MSIRPTVSTVQGQLSPGRLVPKNARAGIAGTQAQPVSFPQVGGASQRGRHVERSWWQRPSQ